MAGLARPEWAGKESSIKLISSLVYHNAIANVKDDISKVLDGDISTVQPYGAVLMLAGTSFIHFAVDKKCRIWAYSGKLYSDGGGVSGKDIKIEKLVNGGWVYYSIRSTKPHQKWYDLTDALQPGEYRLTAPSNYVVFDEWYVESLKKDYFLLQKNNDFYTIENNLLMKIDDYDNAEELFTNGLETITKEDCILIGQQLGKAKIIKMDV